MYSKCYRSGGYSWTLVILNLKCIHYMDIRFATDEVMIGLFWPEKERTEQ